MDKEAALNSNDKVITEKNYWLNKLEGELVRSAFPYEYKTNRDLEYKCAALEFEMGGEVFSNLIDKCNRSDNNLYMILLSVLTVLLSKYSGNKDIMVGAPIFKQNIKGEFINTVLVMRNKLTEEMTFKELLLQVRQTVIEANENQNYPVERLLNQLDTSLLEGSSRLFDTVILVHNVHNREYIQKLKPPVLFSFLRTESCIEAALEYDTTLYGEETAGRIVFHFLNLLKEILKNVNTRISHLNMLSEEEQHNILFEFNNTGMECPVDKTVHELFEEQECRTRNNTAIVYRDESFKYGELNQRANQLARTLRLRGVKADSIVGLMAERSLEMIIGILGIMKAGGAYLPIDPEYPDERIKYMLEDSGARIVLTNRVDRVDALGIPLPVIDLKDEKSYDEEGSNLENINAPSDMVYLIYTSGTTGKPKGVMIEHRNLANYAACFAKEASLTQCDRTILLSSFCFDLCYTSLYPALLSGCELHIVPSELYSNPAELLAYIGEKGITYIKITPSLFNIIFDSDGSITGKECRKLRLLVSGGEQINLDSIERFHRLYPGVKVMNHYGPTEATIGSIFKIIDFDKFELYRQFPVIGRPIDNVGVYILGSDMALMPVGAPGNIYISGSGLARGYLNQPGLTAQSFIKSPLRIHNGTRLYKTGDMGRFLSDGSIEFLGRADYQVKIRGYRVELNEIENQLLRFAPVEGVLVEAKENTDGSRYLCAYVASGLELTVSELRAHLSLKLPEYMIPSYFVILKNLPLTPNGKIDRKALPEPKTGIGSRSNYKAPTNEKEKKLVEVCREILGIEQVSINDNFFELGGDSIKTIQVSAKLLKYGLKLEVKDLFQHPTISEASRYITDAVCKAEEGTIEGEVELAPAQCRFFESNYKDMHHWNQSLILFNKEGLVEEYVVKAFSAIIEHHDALRMIYRFEEGSVVQYNRGIEDGIFVLVTEDLTGIENYAEKIRVKANELQAGLNLSRGPLIRLGLFKTKDGDALLIVIHHLVIDAVSFRIIMEDFTNAYTQVLEDRDMFLQAKTISYKQWAQTLLSYANSDELLNETEYWSGIENFGTALLPGEWGGHSNKNRDSCILESSLTEECTEKLLKSANKAYNTQINDILLTALGLTLRNWTEQDLVLINMEGHGRESIIEGADVSRTVGWFTSNYPVLLDFTKTDSLPVQIKLVKESLRGIPNKGVGYGILKYLTSPENKKMLRFALKPEIGFNYLGQFEKSAGNGGFFISQLPCGEPMSPEAERMHRISILCAVMDGKFKLTLNYNKNDFTESTIRKLGESYEHYLTSIIEHCVSKEDTEVTPSDFGYDLSMEDLEEVMDAVSHIQEEEV